MTGAIRNLGDCIDPAADPASAALIGTDGRRETVRVSYAEVRAAVASMASGIAAVTAPGDHVGLLAGNDPAHLMAFMAVMYAGRCAVPLNWKLPAPTIEAVATDAELAAVIVASPFASKIAPHWRTLPLESLGGEARMGDPALPEPDERACLMYTSGSTGIPKGVPLTHRGYLWAINQTASFAPQITSARTLVAAPLYHMNAQCTLLLSLRYGGQAVILDRFDVDRFLNAIGTFGITEISGVPTMLAMALNRLDEGFEVDLSSVDTISIGSAPLSQHLLDRLRKRFPTAKIDNGFGTTETGFIAFGAHPDPTIERPPLSIGYPHPAIDARLIGPKAPVEGELELRTGMMAHSYWRRPDATAEKFIDGWYRTGDVLRRDEAGFHYFVARADDMIVCGGINLYPAEVEAILERHPAVAQAAVIGIADPVKGEVPIAFIVRAADGPRIDEATLRAFALAEGPPYAHPRQIHFVDSLPLAGTNKIDRRALAAQVTAGEGEAER